MILARRSEVNIGFLRDLLRKTIDALIIVHATREAAYTSNSVPCQKSSSCSHSNAVRQGDPRASRAQLTHPPKSDGESRLRAVLRESHVFLLFLRWKYDWAMFKKTSALHFAISRLDRQKPGHCFLLLWLAQLRSLNISEATRCFWSDLLT